MKRLLFSFLFILSASLSFSQTVVLSLEPAGTDSFITSASIKQTTFSVLSEDSRGDAAKLGLHTIRNRVVVSTHAGLKQMTPEMDYITNFVWTGKSIPTDTAQFKKDLRYCLSNVAKLPTLAVIENEEDFGEQNGTVVNYIAELVAAQEVCKEFHVPVTNGGITMPLAVGITYNYLISIGQTDYAKALLQRNSRATKAQVQWGQTEINLIAANKLCSFFNFHYQFKSADNATDFFWIEQALGQRSGLPEVNNEVAQRVQDPALTTVMINSCKNMSYATLYLMTGTQGQAVPLTDAMSAAAIAAFQY